MTPKEAIDILYWRVDSVNSRLYDIQYNIEEEEISPELQEYVEQGRQALAVIQHHTIPRTKPPTVKGVRNEYSCLVRLSGTTREWKNCLGSTARRFWGTDFDAWLPLPEVTV
jgi:hypothetical protein